MTCSQCKADGIRCIRTKTKAKFKVGSTAKHDAEFPKDQVWLSTKRKKGRSSIEGGISSY